jgi:hypothetical protein
MFRKGSAMKEAAERAAKEARDQLVESQSAAKKSVSSPVGQTQEPGAKKAPAKSSGGAMPYLIP